MASLFKRGKKWYIGWLDGQKRRMISTRTVDKQLAMEALRKFEEEKTRIALGLDPVIKKEPIMLSQFNRSLPGGSEANREV